MAEPISAWNHLRTRLKSEAGQLDQLVTDNSDLVVGDVNRNTWDARTIFWNLSALSQVQGIDPELRRVLIRSLHIVTDKYKGELPQGAELRRFLEDPQRRFRFHHALAERIHSGFLPYVRRTQPVLPTNPPPATLAAFREAGIEPIRAFFNGPNRKDPANRFTRAVKALREEWGYHMPIVSMYTDGEEEADYVVNADYAIYVPAGVDDQGRPVLAFNNEAAIIRALKDFQDETGIKITEAFPGWGFRSEAASFVQKLEQESIALIGPSSQAIEMGGGKLSAKGIARDLEIPVAEASPLIRISGYEANGSPIIDWDQAFAEARRIGYPVMIKPNNGGGGKGQLVADSEDDLRNKLVSAINISRNTFKSDEVFFERYIREGRHIEVQMLGEQDIGLRVCSAQRNKQKVFEWGGPTIVSPEIEAALREYARAYARAVGYKGPGTIEFLVDDQGNIFFMEMNTRLQVEHLVTEEMYGIDLVKEAIRRQLGFKPDPAFEEAVSKSPKKFAINFRVLAEDVEEGFRPSPGLIRKIKLPKGPHVRIDEGVHEGDRVSEAYDNMIMKLTATGDTWEEAVANMKSALRELIILGVKTNIEFGLELLDTDEMRKNGGMGLSVNFVERYLYTRKAYQKMEHQSGVNEGSLRKDYGHDWRNISNPFMLKNPQALIEGLVWAHLHGQEIGNTQIPDLVARYGTRWSIPKPYADEALLATALHAYYERRAEIIQNLLDPRSDISFNPDTIPNEEGLSFQAEINGQMASIHVREVSNSRFAVTINEHTVMVEAQRRDLHTYSLFIDGQRDLATANNFAVYVDARAGTFEVQVEGVRHEIKLATSNDGQKAGVIASPMPGKIVNVLVACGTPVTAGQGLVIVDAMKMENTITAPVSGVVKAIRVMAGDTVQSGHVLVEIEPDVTGEAASSKVAYNFMPDHHLGPRAQLGYIDEAVDKTHYDQVMQAMRERLHGDAPKLLSYIAEYLRGFDYTQDYLKRVLSLLEEVREPSFPIQQALQAVLNQYLDLQNLYAPNNELRDEFEFFIKNWRKVKGRVSKKMGDVLIANLRHFGIRLGDPILDSNKSVIGYHVLPDGVVVKEHSFINVLLRLRQAWNNGSGRRSIVSRLVRLAGSYRMKDEAIRETLMKLYTNAKDSGAQPVVDAVRDTARQIDVVFAQGFNGSPIPDIYAARHAAFLRGRNLVAPAESARMILAIPSAVPQACSELGLGEAHPIARLAHAYGAQIAALYSPDDRFQIFLFRTGKGPKEKNSLVLYAPYPEAPSVSYDDRGVFVGERGLEDYAIRAAEIMKVYQSIEEKNSIRGGLPLKDHEIILDMQELVREADRNGVPHVFTPLHWDTLGKNVFPFLDRRALYRAAVLANTMDSDGRTTRVAHQYVPTRDGQVFAMRTTRDQYFAIEDSEDRDHHLRGLLTIEERAAKFFDGGHYEVIKLNGVEDSAVLLTVGKVKGREVIAYLSDSRTKKKRGAVGAAEGKVMAAAVMLAYLKGMPVVGLNDSGGAKIPEGTPALNYSGIDFFIKEAAQRTPEEFSRWVEAHPNWAFFKALLDQFGNGRPLIEQLKGKNPPLHIALMMGLNSGMVVYGPAELNHVFMRNSSQVAGMLTGENVVYEVKHVKLSNSDIGGAYVLVRKAGTVDQAVDTEEELFDLARRAIDMFSPGVALGDGIIRRFEGSLEDTKAQNTEATIIHLPTLLRHVDHGFFWPYKGDLLHASEVEAGWTQMGGNTVAILGPKLPGGFGSREAIEKADRFARAAVSENIPLIKIVGEKWYSRSRSGGRDVEKRREELTGFLTRSTHVPQVSIITHARGLQMYNVHEGSHVQIFVKSATTTRHELWLAQRKGCIIVDTFKEAMDYASRFVAYAKASSRQALVSTKDNPDRTADLSFVPTDFNLGYDMRKVIGEVFDQNSFLEIGQSDTNNLQGSNLITGLATMNGRVVGVFADNPQIRAGAADWLGADKFRHFVELCKSLKVPMVYMEDSPGFEPGPEQEGADIQGRGGKLLKEIISADVPKVKFVVRKSFGGRNIQGFHPWLSPGTVALSLTNSLIAVMGARAGIPFVYRKDGAYQTLVGTIVNESKALTTLLDTYQPRQDPGDVKRRLSAFAAQIRAIDENYPFKRLDAIKTILGGLDEIISLDETPGQTISPIREKIYLFRELVRRVDELIGKYNKDVADPAKSLTVAKAGDLVRGYLDGIIEPSTSRQAMQEALTLAEKRAAARTRPYAALTRDESRLAHARGRLADLGLHARFVVEDAKNAGRDLLILDGTERFMTSAEVHEVLNVLDELDGKSENAAKFVTYANGDVDKRELLKTEWKSQREKETVRRVALQRPQNLADALLAAVQAADPEQLNNLASQLASVVGALQASTAHLLPLVAALAPAFLAAQFQMRMEFVRTRLVAQIKGGEMRLSSRDMHEELAVYLPELFQLSKADDLEDFIGSLARNALAKIISQGGEGIGADSAQRKCVLVRRVAEDSAYIPIFVFNVSDLSAGSIERVMEDSAIDKRALRIGVYEPFNDRAIKLVLLLDAETNDEDRLRLLVEKLELFKTEGIASIEVWQGQGPDVVRYRYSVNESGITLESSLHLNHLAGAAVTGNGDTPVHSGPRRRILPVAQQAAVSRIPVKEIQKGGQTGGGNPEALSRSTVIGDRTLIPAGDIFGRRRHNHDVMQNGWVEPANGDALDRVLDAADAKTDDATVANGDGAAKTKKSPVGAGFPRPHSAPIRHWSSLAAMRAGGGIRSITSHPGFRPVGR